MVAIADPRAPHPFSYGPNHLPSYQPSMRCPLCDAEFDPAESPAMPFCSERCKLIDLGRWLEEGYSFPADDDPEKYEAN